ncbi:MAG: hypothetical protein ACERKK_04020 [Poseidonibacter sp.]|uniref:hypothetical protein n=1 Tax=Poseidonibacter sp. TaxID=2321188 RepID=UPI00359DCCC2
MSNQCSNTFPQQCKFNKYKEYKECILHFDKKEMSSLHNPYFTEPEQFYNHLVSYIVESVFEYAGNQIENDKDTLRDYLKGVQVPNKENVAKKLKATKIVFTKVSFPNTDDREQYNYETVLKKLGKIWFNYCDFYIPHLDIEHIECFFQDCNFYEYWSLKNFKAFKDLDDLEVYNTCTFHEDINASGGEKDQYLLEYIQFNGCTFKKELTFENIHALKPIFKDWSEFKSSINTLKISNCKIVDRFTIDNYTIENVLFENTVFTEKFEFINNTVNIMDVNNSNFDKLAEFYESDFKQFKIFKSIFTDYTGFEKCEFGKDEDIGNQYITNFQYVTFLSFVNFRNTNFKSGLLFEDTNLKESPNFLNSKISFKNTSRETFRIIKYSFDKLGNHIEANKYFSLEMKKYKEELSKSSIWSQERFIFWFNEKVSNYGQNYLKATMWLLISSFLYTLLIVLSENIEFKDWLRNQDLMLSTIKYLNSWFSSIIIFKKLLPPNLEFATVIFAILQSTLIWHILVSVRRHSKR